MKVAGLWRYPVKSMQGERLERVSIGHRGIEGDRAYGVLDVGSGTIMSAKKHGPLLEGQALRAGVELAIRLPTGETAMGTGPEVDKALTSWLRRPVHLVRASDRGRGTYEMPLDFEDDDSEVVRWEGPNGSFADSSPVHLVTTPTLRHMSGERADLQWEVARFRPNMLLEVEGEGRVEDDWVGRKVQVGGAELQVRKPCSRCVMTTRAQPGGVERQLDVLRHLNASHRSNLGVLASVVREGVVRVGQAVTVTE